MKEIRKRYKKTKEIFASQRWLLFGGELFGVFPSNLCSMKPLKCVGSNDTWGSLTRCKMYIHPLFSCLCSFAHAAQLEILFPISENPNLDIFQGQALTSCLILPSRSCSIFSVFLCHCAYDFVMAITPFCLTLRFLWTAESSYEVQIFWMWGSHFIFLSSIAPILGTRKSL